MVFGDSTALLTARLHCTPTLPGRGARLHQYLDPAIIDALLSEHQSGRADHSHRPSDAAAQFLVAAHPLYIDGRWLPSGVDLELRFVPAGGDPTAESASRWSFTPPAGSSQTLVLSDNGGLRVLRVDNDRATRATPEGQAHIVPAVFHLIVGGHRSHQWATPGGGCLGHLTTDKAEFDATARKLVGMFQKNFAQYLPFIDTDVKAAAIG